MGSRTTKQSPTQFIHPPAPHLRQPVSPSPRIGGGGRGEGALGGRLPVYLGVLSILVLTRLAVPPIAHARPGIPVDPYRRGAAEILLPILDFVGQDDVCDSWIDVQNLGADDAKVLLMSWGEPGFCPPQAAGPQKPECSGVLKPGGMWTFSGAQIPTGTRGGVLYRLATTPYPGTFEWFGWPVTTLADAICVLAVFQVIDDGDGWPRFEHAYRRGGVMDEVDLYNAAGTGQLAATVTRRCPGFRTRGADTIASYNGIALNRVGDVDPDQGGYVVFAPDTRGVTGGDGQPGIASGTTLLYVQNAGLKCAVVDLWFAAHDGCGRARLCDQISLAPLETLHFDAADCWPPNTEGAMWVRASQPVAVVVERLLEGATTTYTGIPSTLRAAFTFLDPLRAAPLPVGPVLSAAYVSNGVSIGGGDGVGDGGLGTHVVVMNTHPSASVRIRLSFLDPSGAVRTSLVDWLCPRGSASYDLAAIGDLPPGWHGAARVVALGTGPLSRGAPAGDASSGDARLAGVARMEGPADGGGAGDGTDGSMSYALVALPGDEGVSHEPSPPIHHGLDAAGSGLIVLPSVRRGRGGDSSTIIVHNAVAAPGFTALRTGLFDANGLVHSHCARLAAGEQLAIDLDALAYLGAGFRGAAVVSAWYWDHGLVAGDVGDTEGATANPVQLTALTLGGDDGAAVDPGGDGHGVVAGTAGIPVRRRDVDRAGIDIWWLVAGECVGQTDDKHPGGSGPVDAHQVQSATTVDRHRRGGAEILLPILNHQGADEVCESAIDVQNLGSEAAKVALVTWHHPGHCPPHAAGPLRVECTGLIRPGASWRLFGAQVPTGSRGGALYRFREEVVHDDWIDFPEECCSSDYLCELLFFNVTGDAADSRRFVTAFREGLMFDGIDLATAAGDGMLAAIVTRSCADPLAPGASRTASYNGIAANQLGDVEPAYGDFVVHAPDADAARTILYVQNAGLDCAIVAIWFGARDGCGAARVCAMRDVAPFETIHVAASDCAPAGWEGAMWVRSAQPVAVVAERRGEGALATYSGFPSAMGIHEDGNMPAPRPIGPALSAPYAVNGVDGLNTSIVIQNLSAVASTRVRVAFIDPNGIERTVLADWLCPRGRGVYDARDVRALPVGWTGTVRVVGDDGARGGPTLLGGVARLVDVNGRVHSAHAMPAASAGPGMTNRTDLRDAHTNSGAGVVAIPALAGAEYPSGFREEADLVIANTVATQGFTEVATYVYDANGLIDGRCDSLMQGEQLTVDTASWAPAMRFRGAAIVSALFWEHDSFDLRGYFVGDQVGIAAAVVASNDGSSADAPDDVVRAGVPFRWSDAVPPVPSTGVPRDQWQPAWWPECPPPPVK